MQGRVLRTLHAVSLVLIIILQDGLELLLRVKKLSEIRFESSLFQSLGPCTTVSAVIAHPSPALKGACLERECGFFRLNRKTAANSA